MRLILFFLGLFCLVSCESNSTINPEQILNMNEVESRYTNERLNISLDNTIEWDIEENLQDIPLVLFSPVIDSNDFFQENITFFSQPLNSETNLNEYTSKSLEEIQQYLLDYKLEQAPENISIKGHEFKRILYSHTAQEVDIKILVYFTIRNGQGIVINCSSLVDTYSEYKPTFEKLVNSLIFIK